MALNAGTRLGHSDVSVLIGEGGMGRCSARRHQRDVVRSWSHCTAKQLSVAV